MEMLTKREVKKLQSVTGHVISVEDFDDLEELDSFAGKITNTTKLERRLLRTPYELCGINFYPFTVAKNIWFIEKVEEWGVEGKEQEALLFWLLTLPLTSDALEAYTDEKDAQKACKKLSRRLHCTKDELTVVYNKCLGIRGDEDSSNSDESDSDYGGMISCLIKEYGGTPDYWIYETPLEVIGSMFEAFARRVAAEESKIKTKGAKNGKAVAPKVTKRLKSLGNFNAKLNQIKEKWSALDGE